MQLESLNNKTTQLEPVHFKLSETIPDEIEEIKFKALRKCVSFLNAADGSIINLHLNELSYKEIAEITDLTENHIAVKMKRIKKQLLDCITPKIKS
jgi:DNA-directed RNA polymerase specialized sigma24 family protein